MPYKEILDHREINSVFAIHISNHWTANDFANLFDSMSKLYQYYNLVENTVDVYNNVGDEFSWNKNLNSLPKIKTLTSSFILEAIKILNSPIEARIHSINYFRMSATFPAELTVKRIHFASPGSIDFLGMGKIFEVIKDLVIHYFPNKEKEYDQLIKQKDIEEKDQKILQMKIENLKKMGVPQKEIMAIVGMEAFHLNKIINLRELGSITNIEITKDS